MRIWFPQSRAFSPYSRAGMWPICHEPSISFPRHHLFTLCGFSMPWVRRRSLHFVPFSWLQYSTSAAAISGVPVPRFRPISGSAPTSRHHSRNSFVPNWFGSIVFQALSSTTGRCSLGPTPSSQL